MLWGGQDVTTQVKLINLPESDDVDAFDVAAPNLPAQAASQRDVPDADRWLRLGPV